MSKTFEAVYAPHRFPPAIIENNVDFENLWQTNQKLALASLAHIAYFNETKLRSFTEQLGANKTFFYDHQGAQAFLALWDDKAILSFRGTQPIETDGSHHRRLSFFRRLRLKFLWHLPLNTLSLRYLNNDILADLKFIPTRFDGRNDVLVHRGFLGELDKIWPGILKNIEEDTGGLPVFVTGHSLGAAMALLAGSRHSFENITTFGEPRTGINIDKAFQSNSHTRYVNGDDPVPKLPPEILFGYEHHGTTMNIQDADGSTDIRYDHSIIYYSENLA